MKWSIILLLFLSSLEIKAQDLATLADLLTQIKAKIDQINKQANDYLNDPDHQEMIRKYQNEIESGKVVITLRPYKNAEPVAPIKCPDCTNLVELAGSISDILAKSATDSQGKFEAHKLQGLYFLAKDKMPPSIKDCDWLYSPIKLQTNDQYFTDHDFKFFAQKDVDPTQLHGFAIQNAEQGELYYYLAKDDQNNFYLIRIEVRNGKEKVLFYTINIPVPLPTDPVPTTMPEIGLKIPWQQKGTGLDGQIGLWNEGDILNRPIYFLAINYSKTATETKINTSSFLDANTQKIQVGLIFTATDSQIILSSESDYANLSNEIKVRFGLPIEKTGTENVLELRYGNTFSLTDKNADIQQNVGFTFLSDPNQFSLWSNYSFTQKEFKLFELGINKQVSKDIFLGAGFSIDSSKRPTFSINTKITP